MEGDVLVFDGNINRFDLCVTVVSSLIHEMIKSNEYRCVFRYAV
jgi:hypothetical protein